MEEISKMGKNLNLSHLTQEECDQIMNVLQKDFEIRRAEQQRVSEAHDELVKEQSRISLLKEKQKFNETSCIVCLERFGVLFHRRRRCNRCKLNVCSGCSQPSKDKKNEFICNVCSKEKAYKILSNQWFYQDSRANEDEWSGSSKVVQYLYKRNSSSTSDIAGIYAHGSRSEVESRLNSGADDSNDIRFPVARGQDLTLDAIRRTEQFNFGLKFDQLLEELRTATEQNISDGLTTHFATTSYGEIMISFKETLKDLLKGFTQRMQIAYESYEPTEKIEVIKERAERDASDVIENFIGDNLNLSQEFTDEQLSYEDLVASTVLSKLLESHRQEVSGTLQQSPNATRTDKDKKLQKKTRQSRHVRAVSDDNLNYGSDVTSDDHGDSNETDSRLTKARSEGDVNSSRHKTDKSTAMRYKKKTFTDKNKSKFAESDSSTEETDILNQHSDPDTEFDQLKEFVKVTQKSRKSKIESFAFDDSEKLEAREEILVKNSVDQDEEKDFQTRFSAFDRVHSSRPPLPDFLEDGSTEEVDPDLLSLNLAIIPEETEEDFRLEEVKKRQHKWKANWIFKGKDGVTSRNVKMKKVGVDSEIPLYVTVPRPENDCHPRIGSRDIEELSDYLDNDHSDLDGTDEDENTFYANTSKELAIIAGQRRPGHVTGLPGDHSLKGTAGHFFGMNVTDSAGALDHASVNGQVIEATKNEIKLLKDLVPAENDDPTFVMAPESVTVQEGEPLRFSCRVAGTAPIDVFWYREGDQVEELEESEDVEIFSNGDKRNIVIYNISKKMGGQYVCIAVNEKGKAIQYLIVTVKNNKQDLKKPEFLKGLKDVEVTEGQSIHFRVKVKGYPPPRINWYKDGTLLKNSRSCRIEKFGNRDYILAIDHASMNDDAEYTVVAENIAGKQMLSAQVIVEPKSDLPVRRQTFTSSTTSGVSDSDSDWSASTRSLMSSTTLPPFTPAASLPAEKLTSSSAQIKPAMQQEENYLNQKDTNAALIRKWARKDSGNPANRFITDNIIDVINLAEDIIHQEKSNTNDVRQSSNSTPATIFTQKSKQDNPLAELDLPDSLDDYSTPKFHSQSYMENKASFDSFLDELFQHKKTLKGQYSRDFEIHQAEQNQKYPVADEKGAKSNQNSSQTLSYGSAQESPLSAFEGEAEAEHRTNPVELPSVNKLTAIFSSMQDDDDGELGGGSLKRVHSITARNVPKEQLEKLRTSAESHASVEPGDMFLKVPGPTQISSQSSSLSSSPPPPPPPPQQHNSDTPSSLESPLQPISSSSDLHGVGHLETLSTPEKRQLPTLNFDKEPILIYSTNDPEFKQQQQHQQQQKQHQQQQPPSKIGPSPKPRKSHLPRLQSLEHQTVKQASTTTATVATVRHSTKPSTQSQQCSTPPDTAEPPHKQGASRIRGGSILARAAFWERKIVDGEVVKGEEFPEIMEV